MRLLLPYGKPPHTKESIMIDVHAPEHGINGVRDFFIHLFTITIGLLIALGLEAGAEAIHHRHQRQEAETLIRREIQDNLTKLRDGAPIATAELHQSQPGVLNEKDFLFQEAPIQDAAWRTANSTGALDYMDYAEVERFSDAYKEQAMLQSMEEQALEDYLELIPVLVNHSKDGVPSPEAAKDAIPFTRRIVAHLSGMLDVGAGTVQSYEAALK
jgi:hypothetical protein